MQDKALLKIAIISSVLGIMLLFLLSSKEIVGELQIGRLDETYLEQNVRITGTIQRFSEYEKIAYLNITQENSVKVVIFKKPDQEFNFTQGDKVEILGKVDEYNGLQIIANYIKILE